MTWMVIWCPFLNLFHQQRQLCDPLHGSREEGLKSLVCLHFQCLQVPLKVLTHFPGESVGEGSERDAGVKRLLETEEGER